MSPLLQPVYVLDEDCFPPVDTAFQGWIPHAAPVPGIIWFVLIPWIRHYMAFPTILT